jgi:preprotein translocase subunit SecG
VISILLQSSKGGGLAGMFGGGGVGMSMFGGRGAASFLSKVSMWLGISFAVTSMSIAILRSKQAGPAKSVIEEVREQSPADILPGSASPGEEIIPGAEGTENTGENQQ